MATLIYLSAVALTPAGSIAKPTDSSAAADPEVTSSKAAPASSPKPTVAPITSSPQNQPSSKTSLPEQDPASVGKLSPSSPSQASDFVEQADSVENETLQEGDQLDDEHHSPKPESGEAVTSTKGDTLPSHTTKPAEPDTGSPGASANDEPATGKNALSVLLEAQSSAKVAEPSHHVDPAQSGHDDAPSNDHDLATQTLDPFTIALADGGSATVRIAESSLIVAHNGLSAGAMHGSEVTIGTHIFSAAPQGDAVVVDNVATHAVPSPADSPPALTFSADGRTFSANNQDGDVLIFDGSRTLTAHAGEAITIGSQTISLNAGASELVLGTTTLTIPTEAAQSTAFAPAMWMADGSTFTASKQDDSIVIHGPDVTTTLEPGATATIAGEILSVPFSDDLLVHNGNTFTFESSDVAATVDGTVVTTLLPNGQEITASAVDGDSIIVQQGSRRFTLTAGEQTIVNGETISVAQSGGALVIGSETISLLVPASTTVGTSSGETSPGGSGSDTMGETADGSSSTSAPEAEDFEGGAERGGAISLTGVLLFVYIVFCLS